MRSRDRLILAILGVVGLVAAFWFVALAPKRERASELSAQVTQAQVNRDAATAKAANAEQAKARYASDYGTVARLGKAVPPKADVPSLVFQLESAARAAKVDFRRVTVQDTPPAAPGAAGKTGTKSGISSTPFSFAFEGSFFALQRMLAEIDRFSRVKGTTVSVSGRLLTLDHVKLSAGREGLPSVKAEISANAYVAPLPSSLPGRSAAASTASTSSDAAPSEVTP